MQAHTLHHPSRKHTTTQHHDPHSHTPATTCQKYTAHHTVPTGRRIAIHLTTEVEAQPNNLPTRRELRAKQYYAPPHPAFGPTPDIAICHAGGRLAVAAAMRANLPRWKICAQGSFTALPPSSWSSRQTLQDRLVSSARSCDAICTRATNHKTAASERVNTDKNT